ncbi:MAG: extracellular solute-binding protein, partial [Eubacteriales bacterium]
MQDAIKKLLSALLATAMLFAATACSDAGDKTGTTADPSGTAETEPDETRVYPDLPDVKFDGYEFRMAHWEISGATILYDLDADEETGDIINDSVYKRNLAIEENYNVQISADYLNHADLINTCTKTVRAGDLPYDVYFPRTYESTQLVQQGVLLDLHTLPYIDWDKPWWDSQSVAELSLSGMLPMVEGDITLMDKSATACIFYNKKVQKDNAIEDLYQLVYRNEWTLDKMVSLSRSVTADLNGDSVLDGNDRWGVVAYDDWTYIMLHGSDC